MRATKSNKQTLHFIRILYEQYNALYLIFICSIIGLNHYNH